MSISNVRICNIALAYIGGKAITSLTEDSKNARDCNMIFENERDDLMAAHRWNFAINRATLAQLTAAPAYGYDHAYQIPGDCLRVLEMKEERESGTDWAVEGSTIVTNADTVLIKYIKKETDPQKWSTYFRNALIHRLAALLAIPVSNSRALSEQYWTSYEDKLNDAYEKNAIEGHADEDDKPIENEGSWLSERD